MSIIENVNGTSLAPVAGTSTYLPAWNKVISAFSQFHEANFSFAASSAVLGVQALDAGSAYVSFTEVPVEDIYAATSNPLFQKYLGLPYLAQTFVLIYNIVGYNDVLILDTNTTIGIMLGRITTWNHPELVALNPNLAPINRTINIVVRSTDSATTLVLSKWLTENSAEWAQNYGAKLLWPVELENVTSIIYTQTHIFSCFASVYSYADSISVATFPFFYAIGFAKGVNAAYFKTLSGKVLRPDDASLMDQTVDGMQWAEGSPITIFNTKNTDQWPYVGVGALIVKKDLGGNINCAAAKELMRFLRWTYTDDTANYTLRYGGYYLPPDRIANLAIKVLDNIQCEKSNLLTVKTSFSDRTGTIITTVIFWLLILVSAVLLFVYNRKSLIAVVYSCVLLVGMLFCGISMVFWILEPNQSGVCNMRRWFMGLGLVIFSGGVFFRSYQLKKIHDLVKNGKYKKGKKIDHLKLAAILISSVIIIELILLVALQSTAPFTAQIAVTNSVDRVGEYRCVSVSSLSWLLVQSIYLVIVLSLGVIVLYTTWNIASSVDDTRINVMMIFICLVTLIVGDVIIQTNAGFSREFTQFADNSVGETGGQTYTDTQYTDISDISESWWAISIIFLWALSMMCSVYLPKIVKSYYKTSQTGSGGTEHQTGQQGSGGTPTKSLAKSSASKKTMTATSDNLKGETQTE